MQYFGVLMSHMQELDVRLTVAVPGDVINSNAMEVEGRTSIWAINAANMMDAENPVTVAYYDTYIGGPAYDDRPAMFNGAFGIDVRNADGLIVISDMNTGFWAFRMDGFLGWDGPSWGMPDISSVHHAADSGNNSGNLSAHSAITIPPSSR